MKKFLNKVISLLYQYYSKGGTKDIAYESALLALCFFIMLHVLQIKAFFWGGGIAIGDGKGENLLFILLLLLPLYFLFTLLFPKKIVIASAYLTNPQKGYMYVVLYTILSISALVLIVLFRR